MHLKLARALYMNPVNKADVATAATLCALPQPERALAMHPRLRFDAVRNRRAAALHARPESVIHSATERADLLKLLIAERRATKVDADPAKMARATFGNLRGLLARCMVNDRSVQDALMLFLLWFRATPGLDRLVVDALQTAVPTGFAKPRPHVLSALDRELASVAGRIVLF